MPNHKARKICGLKKGARNQMNIKDILDKHAAWLRGEPEGVKADLTGANLSKANLSKANLSKANLSGGNLSKALNIDTLSWDSNTAFYPLQCPETGTYTAYKKANNLIVELEIPYDALRSSATSRKCRASKARVISITDLAGHPAGDRVLSDYAYSPKIEYIVGQTIEIPNFDTNRWHECAPGIHHYITREEAVKHEN
nr:MAG TPA: pentapeptide repeat protein [Caudoviricetes sp.]